MKTMMTHPKKEALVRAACRLAFAAAVFAFWGVCRPYALAWQEQFQLFLFDGAYLAGRLSVPGGAAAYVAECLVQCYNHPYLGGAVLALVYLGLHGLVWSLMKRESAVPPGGTAFVLSFLPSLGLWFMMGDENVLLSYPLSLMLALAAMRLCPSGGWGRGVCCALALPLVYWAAGPVVLALAVYLCVGEVRRGGSRLLGLCVGVLWVVYALACVVLSASVVPYPLRWLMGGIRYCRVPEVLPYSFVLLPLVCLLLVWLASTVERAVQRQKRSGLWTAGVAAVVAATAVLTVPRGFDAKKAELMEYDYFVRLQRWTDIVRKAERRQPDLPMSVCATNLALGMTNQLGDRAFQFYQHGAEGLLPSFARDFNSTLLTGEAYFHLGLVNTAQRFAMEAMEAIPNYNKSGRVVKRLAETNLINGQYAVAEKYLRMLTRTMFYRRWAQSRLALLADTARIDTHPLYGRMRRLRLQEDYLFSEAEVDKTCGQLFSHNRENTLALQYLLVRPLLARDVNTFMNYYGYVNSQLRYNPAVCQEAVAFACMMRKTDAPPGLVSNAVMQRFKQFAQTYSFKGKNSPELEAFRGTVWHYLMKNQLNEE